MWTVEPVSNVPRTKQIIVPTRRANVTPERL
jgi:hypothetical protein